MLGVSLQEELICIWLEGPQEIGYGMGVSNQRGKNSKSRKSERVGSLKNNQRKETRAREGTGRVPNMD